MAKQNKSNNEIVMNRSTTETTPPVELSDILKNEQEALAFFQSLTAGYQRGYNDWVGGAKSEATRRTRAEKALLMLKNKQKTLKTV
jgi:uncharacterized protein YdeI (YjbR/CyaY-like superfamily)